MLRVDIGRLDDWLVEELEEELVELVDDELPKGFWTDLEWYEMNKEKVAIRNEVKRLLREEDVYFYSLQNKGQEEC